MTDANMNEIGFFDVQMYDLENAEKTGRINYRSVIDEIDWVANGEFQSLQYFMYNLEGHLDFYRSSIKPDGHPDDPVDPDVELVRNICLDLMTVLWEHKDEIKRISPVKKVYNE